MPEINAGSKRTSPDRQGLEKTKRLLADGLQDLASDVLVTAHRGVTVVGNGGIGDGYIVCAVLLGQGLDGAVQQAEVSGRRWAGRAGGCSNPPE